MEDPNQMIYFTANIFLASANLFCCDFLQHTIDDPKVLNLLSAYDVISRYAVVVMQWPQCHAVAQASLNICKLCFKFLFELSEC